MEYKRGSLSNEELIHLYESILWPRMIEEKMLVLLRQGKISNGKATEVVIAKQEKEVFILVVKPIMYVV
jgi:TPP-dependent pyruvate/acetoin dehydrogenase alpha subunit